MSNFSDDEDIIDDLEEQFNMAAMHVQNIHAQLQSTHLLDLYALYKQSTCGTCNTPKPGIFSAQARAKWLAWNNLGNLDKKAAMELYIQKVTDLSPKWDDECEEKSGWVSVSVPKCEPEAELQESEKTAFEYIKENNISKLREVLIQEDINRLDDSGLGLLHWATDRNASEILKYLLDVGANVNLQDSEGQTPLHYASSCGHRECVDILLKYGADRTIEDNEKQTCIDAAYDLNIRGLLEK